MFTIKARGGTETKYSHSALVHVFIIMEVGGVEISPSYTLEHSVIMVRGGIWTKCSYLAPSWKTVYTYQARLAWINVPLEPNETYWDKWNLEMQKLGHLERNSVCGLLWRHIASDLKINRVSIKSLATKIYSFCCLRFTWLSNNILQVVVHIYIARGVRIVFF